MIQTMLTTPGGPGQPYIMRLHTYTLQCHQGNPFNCLSQTAVQSLTILAEQSSPALEAGACTETVCSAVVAVLFLTFFREAILV